MNLIARMMKHYIKTPLKYALPLLFVGSLVLVSISGCLSLHNTNTAVASPTATPATPNGTASNGKISITAINQGTYASDNQFEQPAAGNKYVQIYVTVTNVNYPDETIGNQLFFTLFDSNNVGHQPTLASFGNGGLQSISNSNPGQKTAGTLIFEISQSANPLSLVYNDMTNDLTITWAQQPQRRHRLQLRHRKRPQLPSHQASFPPRPPYQGLQRWSRGKKQPLRLRFTV